MRIRERSILKTLMCPSANRYLRKHWRFIHATLSLVLLMVLVLPAASIYSLGLPPGGRTQAMTSASEQSLRARFTDYDLLEVDLKEASRAVESRGEFSLRIRDTDYDLRLEPNNLLAPGYRSVVMTEKGEIEEPSPHISTYRGRIDGEAGSDVRLLIQDNLMFGYIRTAKDWIFIDPLAKYELDAHSNQLIAYRDADIRPEFRGNCGSTGLTKEGASFFDATELQKAKAAAGLFVSKEGDVGATGLFSNMRMVEIATEFDFEFFQRYGSNTAQANAVIRGVLNQVDGIYRAELNFTLLITFQHGWTIFIDPYWTTDAHGLLDEFKNHWNGNMTNVQRDVAHLFTGKTLNGSTYGTSFVGMICSNPESAYSLSRNAWFITVAHELGHNLGAMHDDELSPPDSRCGGGNAPIMCGGGGKPYFSQRSKDDIFVHIVVSEIGGHRCLDAAPPGLGAFFRSDGYGNINSLSGIYSWRNSWYSITPGDFGSNSGDGSPPPGRTDLLFYDRYKGEGEFYTTDGSGNMTMLGRTITGWRTSWDMIIPGDFGGDSHTDLLFYDRVSGQGQFYTTNGAGSIVALGPLHSSWRTSWDMIIPGNFGGDSHTDLLFYDRLALEGEFYTTDGNGNISHLGGTKAMKPTLGVAGWDLIIPGEFGGDSHTDLLFYYREGGLGTFYTVDSNGNVNALGPPNQWGTSWSLIIPGNFYDYPGSRSEILFYDRDSGLGEFYTTDGAGHVTMLSQAHAWWTGWDLIIPGDFGGTFNWSTDLLFYQH